MIKDFLIVRGKSTVPFETIRRYQEFEHAPIALNNPVISAQMKRFNFNNPVFDTAWDSCLYPPIVGLVNVVEHEVGGWDGFNRVVADEDYIANVRPNEEYMLAELFYDQPQFIQIDEELTVFSSNSPGSLRMFDFVRRPMGMSVEDFSKKLEDDGAWAAVQLEYRASVSKRVHSLAGAGSAPIGVVGEPFDAVVEVWIADASLLATLVAEQKQSRSAFIDPSRSFTVMTQERQIRG